jgi:uncharacterized protein YutE (UPF0331/DUF86 family)
MWIREPERMRIRPYLQELRKQAELLRRCLNSDLLNGTDHGMVLLALERALHIGCECITDIGNVIIDACIMRDPSSYQDIVTILYEENVLDAEVAESLLPLVSYRKTLVHDYLNIESDQVIRFAQVAARIFPMAADQLERFVEHSQ